MFLGSAHVHLGGYPKLISFPFSHYYFLGGGLERCCSSNKLPKQGEKDANFDRCATRNQLV